ncbi:esterase/lipase family protein [Alkalinema pantanalense CENA528]|uniref:esterase/lipase family protein n=1 Tax=Alkalinema pantanalense TaxID=1620705 RepID=UPI003D6EC200
MMLPTVIVPGYFAPATEYQAFEQLLSQLSIPTVTVPLTKWDWLPTLGGRSIRPIIEKIDRTVQDVRQQFDTSEINLVGHSAGGWIARIYLGATAYDIHPEPAGAVQCWQAHQWVRRLVTLGTPHTSQERWTRKNLEFVNTSYPGAFEPTVRYVCVAGKSVYGEKKLGQWLAYSSYELTCGRGDCWGDGITPVESAHLAGAENITLEGVRHAPKSPGLWYGSPTIVPQWIEYLED